MAGGAEDLRGIDAGDLQGINEIIDQVESLLKDGRKYLAGAVLSLADIAFAAINDTDHRSILARLR